MTKPSFFSYAQIIALKQPSLSVGHSDTPCSNTAKNLGFHLRDATNIDMYAQNTSHKAYCQIQCTSPIYHSFYVDAAKTAYALVVPKLDDGNSFFYDSQTYMIDKHQKVKMAATDMSQIKSHFTISCILA